MRTSLRILLRNNVIKFGVPQTKNSETILIGQPTRGEDNRISEKYYSGVTTALAFTAMSNSFNITIFVRYLRLHNA